MDRRTEFPGEIVQLPWGFEFPNQIIFIKKKKFYSVYSKMDESREYYTEWSKSEKENITWYHLYVESKKKNDTNEPIYDTNKLTDLENKFMVTKGEGGGWGVGKLGVWD